MKILTDMHTHTIATTHAYSTIDENAKAAKELGLEAIAMTDHCGTIPDAAHIWHFHNLRALPREMSGVKILRGIEVNITDINGTLDMDDDTMRRLDVVIASIHRPCYADLDKEDHTTAYMAAVEHECVDIIGHSGTPDLKYDYRKVIKRAGELGKLIEINGNTFNIRKQNIPNCREIALICKELGTMICVNSDAHHSSMIGDVGEAVKMLEEIDFPEELIANRSFAAFQEFLKRRGKEIK